MDHTNPCFRAIEQALITILSTTPITQDRAWSDAGRVFSKCSKSFCRRSPAPSAPRRNHPVFASVSQHLHHWMQQRLGGGHHKVSHHTPSYTLAADDGPQSSSVAEERVLISEVRGVPDETTLHTSHASHASQIEVRGVDGELRRIAEAALTTKPNFAYTLSEIQDDIGRVFDTGYFTKTVPISEDTRDGVKLTIEVRCIFSLLMNFPILDDVFSHP